MVVTATTQMYIRCLVNVHAAMAPVGVVDVNMSRLMHVHMTVVPRNVYVLVHIDIGVATVVVAMIVSIVVAAMIVIYHNHPSAVIVSVVVAVSIAVHRHSHLHAHHGAHRCACHHTTASHTSVTVVARGVTVVSSTVIATVVRWRSCASHNHSLRLLLYDCSLGCRHWLLLNHLSLRQRWVYWLAVLVILWRGHHGLTILIHRGRRVHNVSILVAGKGWRQWGHWQLIALRVIHWRRLDRIALRAVHWWGVHWFAIGIVELGRWAHWVSILIHWWPHLSWLLLRGVLALWHVSRLLLGLLRVLALLLLLRWILTL